MIYVENVFLCLCAPLLIMAVLLKGETRRYTVFFIFGLAACLLSAYINGFLAALTAGLDWRALDAGEAAIRLTPVCEELMKAFPVFIYIALLKPVKEKLAGAALAVGLGFATLENCCYLMQYGAQDMLFVLVRGFSAGVVHAICAAILGYGLARFYGQVYLFVSGAFALLCAVTTFHAMYNLLVSSEGGWLAAGYAMPLVAAAAVAFVIKWHGEKLSV